MRRFGSIILAGVVLPTSLAGQAPTYQLAVGDTLVYEEDVRTRSQIGSSAGGPPSSLVRRASIEMSSQQGSTWLARYADFDVRSIHVMGVIAPKTEFLMGRPFVLSIEPTGQVDLVEPPTLKSEFTELFDPELQFVDFLIGLPNEPMRPGVAWSDTVASSGHSGRSSMTVVRRMRVVGDTVFNGRSATVVAVDSEVTLESALPVPGWNTAAQSSLVGSETGTAIIDPGRGVMLERVREGEMTGSVLSDGARRPIEVSYSGTISIAR